MKKYLIPFFLLCSVTTFLQLASFAQTSQVHDHSKTPSHQAQIDEDDIIGWFWERSDIAFHAGDYPRAIALHKAIVALDPHDVESYSVAAWLMWSLGNGDEAQQHIERGLKANPDNWEMWDAAGQQDDLQKYFSKAQDAYARAVKLIPAETDSQMLRRRLAHAAENADDLQTAQETWKQLTQDYPTESVNSHNLKRVQQKLHPSRTSNYLANPLAIFSSLLRKIAPAI